MTKEISPQELAEEAQNRTTYKIVAVDTPAVGAEWTITVPAGKIWEILRTNYVLTTDATIQNRNSGIEIFNGTNTMRVTRAPENHTASTAITYLLGRGIDNSGIINAVQTIHAAQIFLMAGWIFRSKSTLLQATDAYTAIKIYVREIDIT